jgi:hypothetical protein
MAASSISRDISIYPISSPSRYTAMAFFPVNAIITHTIAAITIKAKAEMPNILLYGKDGFRLLRLYTGFVLG